MILILLRRLISLDAMQLRYLSIYLNYKIHIINYTEVGYYILSFYFSRIKYNSKWKLKMCKMEGQGTIIVENFYGLLPRDDWFNNQFHRKLHTRATFEQLLKFRIDNSSREKWTLSRVLTSEWLTCSRSMNLSIENQKRSTGRIRATKVGGIRWRSGH